MKHLAVITARSGQNGLKDKNIKLLEGKPLLVYSIEAARQSGKFDCIHVSTDSENMHRLRGSMERMCRFCVMRHLPRTLPGPGMC